MFNIFCCKRKKLKISKTQNEIKLKTGLNTNQIKNSQSLEENQSQSLSMISNNLNNSTKDNIIHKQNKFNIVNHINDNRFDDKRTNNRESIKNVVYNIINVDNINNINNNKKFFGINDKNNNNNKIKFNLNNNKEYIDDENLNEREKKIFENHKELSNKENEINSKILEIIKINKRLNIEKKNKLSKNSVINDVIKFKKFSQEKEKSNNMGNNQVSEYNSKK